MVGCYSRGDLRTTSSVARKPVERSFGQAQVL